MKKKIGMLLIAVTMLTAAFGLSACADTSIFAVTFQHNAPLGAGIVENMPSGIERAPKGSLIPKPAKDPTLVGYVFDGWYKDSGCTVPWNFDADTVLMQTRLYAKWIPLSELQCAVNFHVNLTNELALLYRATRVPSAAEGLEKGSTLPKPALVPYLYLKTDPDKTEAADAPRFGGWYKEPACQNAFGFGAEELTERSITLYARWVGADAFYTVTFAANKPEGAEGQVLNVPAAIRAEEGQLVAMPPVPPSLEGYRFTGWYIQSACETEWNFGSDTVAEESLTLYAGWAQGFSVTFAPNKPDGAEGEVTGLPAPVFVQEGEPVASPAAAPTLEGYVFAGWYKEYLCENEWNFAADTVSADIHIYAGWSPAREVRVAEIFADLLDLIDPADPDFIANYTHAGIKDDYPAEFRNALEDLVTKSIESEVELTAIKTQADKIYAAAESFLTARANLIAALNAEESDATELINTHNNAVDAVFESLDKMYTDILEIESPIGRTGE